MVCRRTARCFDKRSDLPFHGANGRLAGPAMNNFGRSPMRKIITALAGTAAVLVLSAGAHAQTLRASHQFPGGKGDARDEMVQIIAREAKAANVGLEIQVYPGASLFKPNDQWNALTGGQLDISSFPLD